jgi:hypothetical protein
MNRMLRISTWLFSTAMLASLIVLLGVSNAHAETIVSGNITADTTWTKTGSPYIVGRSYVNAGVTLTIEPGVEVRFTAGGWLSTAAGAVSTIHAQGTAEEPITFTSAAAAPQAGDWAYLYVYPTGVLNLRHCVVEYGGSSGSALAVHSANVTVQDCTIRDNSGHGIHLSATALTPTFERLLVERSHTAIYQESIDMQPVYRELRLRENQVNAVFVNTGNTTRDLTLDGTGIVEGMLSLGRHYVGAGTTMTVTPGSTLSFRAGGWLSTAAGAVSTIHAQGTAEEPITFTSAAAAPQAGDWAYLYVYPTGVLNLRHCVVEYGGSSGSALAVHSANVTVQDCTIRDNSGHGIHLSATALTPTFERLLVERSHTAIYQESIDMQPVYRELRLRENQVNAVFVNTGNTTRDLTLDGTGIVEGMLSLGRHYVGAGTTMTVTPGSTLSFRAGGWLSTAAGAVSTIHAQGAAEEPITFTSAAAAPQAGDWAYLYVYPTGVLNLRHCVVEFANQGIFVLSSQVTVQSCHLHHNKSSGMFVSGAAPLLLANQISDNGLGIVNETPDIMVNAMSTWWGSYLGPHHPILNPRGRGNGVSNGVMFEPWTAITGGQAEQTLDAIAPTAVGNAGASTFSLSGLDLAQAASVQLAGAGGELIPAVSVRYKDEFEIFPTFPLTGAAPGVYDVVVQWHDGATQTLPAAVTVTPGHGGHFWSRLSTPDTVRLGRAFPFIVEYGNDGDADILAPWITVQVSPGVQWWSPDGEQITTPHFNLMAISPDSAAGVLRTGQRATVEFTATWSAVGAQPVIRIWTATADELLSPQEMIELAGYEAAQSPWPDVAAALAPSFAAGFATYLQSLAELATRAGDAGAMIQSVDDLLIYAVDRQRLVLSRQAWSVSNWPTLPTLGDQGDLCIERHDQYATHLATYGIGSRTSDGAWVPWPGGVSPQVLGMQVWHDIADTARKATRVYFLSNDVPAWIDHYIAGSGAPWVADYGSGLSDYLLDQLATPHLRAYFDLIRSELEVAISSESDPPYGVSTYHAAAQKGPLDFAEFTFPSLGNPLWNFGQSDFWLGRTSDGSNIGFEVELSRYSEEKVHYRATDVPARLEDIFQIWEEKVNSHCLVRNTDGNGYRPCPGYKKDFLVLFLWAYMLDRFGPARCFNWYINVIVPEISGVVRLAGLKADAGDDFTIMVGEGEDYAPVTLPGGFVISGQGDGKPQLVGPGDPEEERPFVWNGLPVDPPDVLQPTVHLSPGDYVFLLTVNARTQTQPSKLISDLDSITVRVLPYEPEDEKKPIGLTSWDPNDKVGPTGAGDSSAVAPGAELLYTIRFENDATLANAAAQEVRITDRLDPNLDWSTFSLRSFGFWDRRYTAPPAQKVHSLLVEAPPSAPDAVVAFQSSLDPTTGDATFTFTTLDPVTGQLTDDPTAGFLPPNDDTGRGEGFVTFAVRPRHNPGASVTVRNQANIVFDINAPIVTNQTSHVIDPLPPTSSVEPLASASESPFWVRWSGADDPGGSGVALYDIFVAVDNGPFTPWLTNTPATTARFDGQVGRTYHFYSVARDAVRNRQDTPSGAQASTRVTQLSGAEGVFLPLVQR